MLIMLPRKCINLKKKKNKLQWMLSIEAINWVSTAQLSNYQVAFFLSVPLLSTNYCSVKRQTHNFAKSEWLLEPTGLRHTICYPGAFSFWMNSPLPSLNCVSMQWVFASRDLCRILCQFVAILACENCQWEGFWYVTEKVSKWNVF